jgi:EAL domain-containing protein (putative c-di-GMP-specific phosphodiesterase class I)
MGACVEESVSLDVHETEAPSRMADGGSAPLCYLLDCEQSVRRLVGAVADSFRIELEVFATVQEMLRANPGRKPDLIVLDATVAGTEGVEIIDRLAAARFSCPIQIVSGLTPVLIEQVRRQGERSGLHMLPVLHKPLSSSGIRNAVASLGLRRDRLASVEIDLHEVLVEGWLEVWYQPTINLKHRNMIGAEAFVRARHPDHGILGPDAFMPGAAEADLLYMTRRVLGRALHDWPAFAALGIPLDLSVNIPVVALTKLSLFAILWEQKPDAPNWPGLTLEITEEEAVPNIALATKAIAELRPYGISIAVDNFGSSYYELSRLAQLPFKELKIDRSTIASCDSDRMSKGLCETIVEFAHKYGMTAAAEGIETAGEMTTLQDMNCDVGQGFLFARPQPKSELLALIRHRAKRHTA